MQPAPDSAAVLDAIRRIVRALRQSSRQAEAELGVSGAQLFVLQKLAEADEPLSLSALAARTLTHPSSVSVVVGRLAESGYVTRTPSPDDARRVEVKIAAKGRTFLKKHSPITAQQRLAHAVAQLPATRRVMLASLLDEVVANAGFAVEEAGMFFEDEGRPS